MAGLKMTPARKQYLELLKGENTKLGNVLEQMTKGEPMMELTRNMDSNPDQERWLLDQYMKMRGID